jgi:hypothetical protein
MAIPIQGFRGAYRWLSNFWPAKVKLHGLEFPTTEHAYQAAKSNNPDDWLRFTTLPKPSDAKRAGRYLNMRSTWDSVKLFVMEDVTRQKYQDPTLKALLLSTGDALLEETNHWNDTFWGVCNGVGHNHLGKILMKIREELRGQA